MGSFAWVVFWIVELLIGAAAIVTGVIWLSAPRLPKPVRRARSRRAHDIENFPHPF